MRSSSSTRPGTTLFGLFLLSQVLLLVGVLWLPSEVTIWSLGLVLGVSYLVLMVLQPWTVVPLIVATTAPAGHLRTTEVRGDHVSHEYPYCHEEYAPGNYKPTALQFPVRFKLSADFGDYLIVEGCGGFR